MSLFIFYPLFKTNEKARLSASAAGAKNMLLFGFLLVMLVLSLYTGSLEAGMPKVPAEVKGKLDRSLLHCFFNNKFCGVLLMLEPPTLEVSLDSQQLVSRLQSHAEKSQVDLKNYLTEQNVAFDLVWIQHAVAFVATWPLILYLFMNFKGVNFAHLNSHTVTYCSAPFGSQLDVARSKIFDVPRSLVDGLEPHGNALKVAFFDSGWSMNNSLLIEKYAGTDPTTGIIDHNYSWFSPSKSEPEDTIGHGSNTIRLALDSESGISDKKTRFIAASCEENMNPGSLVSTQSRSCHLAALQWFLAPTDSQGKNPDPTRGPKLILTGFPVQQISRDFRFAYEILATLGKIVIAPLGNRAELPAKKIIPPEELPVEKAISPEDEFVNSGLGEPSNEPLDVSMPSSVITVASVSQDGSYSDFNDAVSKADVAYRGENLRTLHSDVPLHGTSLSAAMVFGSATFVLARLTDLCAPQLKTMLKKNSVHFGSASGPGVVNMSALLENVASEFLKKDVCDIDKSVGTIAPSFGDSLPFRVGDGFGESEQLESRKKNGLKLPNDNDDEDEITKVLRRFSPTENQGITRHQPELEPLRPNSIAFSRWLIQCLITGLMIMVSSLVAWYCLC